MLLLPVTAPGSTDTSSASVVAETNDVVCTVTPAREMVATAPGRKSLPLTTTERCDAPCGSELGAAADTAGLRFTAKQARHVVVTLPGLVTVTSRGPAVAEPATVTVTVIDVGELTTVEAIEMPVPENLTVAAGWKPSPWSWIVCADAP